MESLSRMVGMARITHCSTPSGLSWELSNLNDLPLRENFIAPAV